MQKKKKKNLLVNYYATYTKDFFFPPPKRENCHIVKSLCSVLFIEYSLKYFMLNKEAFFECRRSNVKQSHDSLGCFKRSADGISYFKEAKKFNKTSVIIYRVMTLPLFI